MIAPTLISHVPASTNAFVGSPSIAQLRSGELIASHDYFGPGSGAATSGRTEIFGSVDGGVSWHHRTTLTEAFWSSLFVHHDRLYLLGTNREHGALVIRESVNGTTWSKPVVLLPGKWHTAPVPVVHWQGRLWRGVEDAHTGHTWPSRYRARCTSIATDANLLDPHAWSLSNALGSSAVEQLGAAGWLEGNMVVTPSDTLALLMRVESHHTPNRAAQIHVDATGKLSFAPHNLITLPGGTKKFTVRYDTETSRYLALTNPVLTDLPNTPPSHVRNTLALVSSSNLTDWHTHTTLLTSDDVAHHGFQYADWILDDADLLAVVRTAAPHGTDQPANFHDANQLTFFRLKDFRALLNT